MSAEQTLIKIEEISEANAPAIYVAGGLQQFIDLMKGEVLDEVPDLTTRKGRERIASLAAKVSKSKTAVEKPGRDYLRRLKEMPKVVEAELRDFVAAMDSLRDQVRQPLTDWQAAEDARVDRHNNAIAHLKLNAQDLDGITAEDLADRIAKVEAVALGEQWEEFEAEAARAKDDSLKVLRAALTARQQYEAEQAELERLRNEKAARDEQDRIDAAARQAVEDERQRVARDQQAQRDAEAQRIARAEQQTREAEQRARQAETDRIAAEQQAELDRQAAAIQAEREIELAREDERRRADAAAAEIVRQQQARERDEAHRRSINRAALEAFIAGGMPEACAKQAVTLIAQRKIPNISISY
ncbi:hypothetical protein [Pseudomonas sp. DG56-2]|uniref:hypothetical protein n=1 Tax=Pseudomonas sp. DG56-2 TaxID=2320270 RepID=UPI0010A5D5F2|nr:hypothetical protein [Pseudomonas sp. DG56-2]